MKNSLYSILGFLIIFPTLVLAQTSGGGGGEGGAGSGSGGSVSLQNPLGDVTISSLLQSLLEILIIFAIPIVVFFIIYAGFLYVTARGNVETITKAHRALLYSLIGGVLILGANVLIEVIGNTVDEFRR